MAVSGWFSSCARLEAISPMAISREVVWKRSCCACARPALTLFVDIGQDHQPGRLAADPLQPAPLHLEPLLAILQGEFTGQIIMLRIGTQPGQHNMVRPALPPATRQMGLPYSWPLLTDHAPPACMPLSTVRKR
jgi:hypothetical protein